MSSTGPISIRLVVCVASVSNQVISEFTQRDGRKKRTAKHLCVTKVTGLLPETHKGFCYYLGVLSSHNINVSWSFTKDLFKGICSLAKSFFKQNYCHACHTRVAVFFPLPSCCELHYCAKVGTRAKGIEDGTRAETLATHATGLAFF